MKYESRDQTIRIRREDEEELRKDTGPEPEFRLYVSPVANGWWTRAEVEALAAKLQAALKEGQTATDERLYTREEVLRVINDAANMGPEDFELDDDAPLPETGSAEWNAAVVRKVKGWVS